MRTVIIGAGGFAGEVVEAIRSQKLPSVELDGIYDDDTRLKAGPVHGLPYLGTIRDFVEDHQVQARYVLAIGDTDARQRIVEQLVKARKEPITVIHSSASVSATAKIAPGSYIAAFVFIGPRVTVGDFALVNVGVSIGHDAQIGAFVQLCPGVRISGYCQLQEAAFCGSNSGLSPGVRMGAGSKLAAGSFAFRHVPANTLAVGVPAKPVR